MSTGLARAGFTIAAAVEIDEDAAATFHANHPHTKVVVRDVRKVKGRSLARRAKLDLLVGCAPCQGFCALTNKWGRDDPRNKLLLELARLAEELRPTALIMENVPGVLDRGARIFERFLRRLRAAGYQPTFKVVQMADYGVPQRRRRLVLVAGRGFAIPIPAPTHARVPVDGRAAWRTVREALAGTRAPTRWLHAHRHGGPRSFNWHVVRTLQPQTRARLRAAVPGKPWTSVASKLRPRCHRGPYVGFTNVYGRMRWDEPSPTITSGCTTPAKGRFGHPDRRRTTISVREAATLQTFPLDYDFATGHIDDVCEMVGNSVPPAFAEILGHTVRAAVEAHDQALARGTAAH